MSDIRRDEIIYEEGWRDAYAPKSEPAPEHESETPKEKPAEKKLFVKDDSQRPLLTILQLVLCMTAALVLFILKAMDSGAFYGFMERYHEEMSKPIISQGVFDAVDWNALFGGDDVSVTATPDEILPG